MITSANYQQALALFEKEDIEKISCDSRKILPGYIFIAINGINLNGEKFIPEVIKNGAKMVVASTSFQDQSISEDKIVRVENTRKFLSLLASNFYPSQPPFISAVTGTNGKTSTVNFFQQLATYCGIKSASIGTLGIITEYLKFDNNATLTSPDSITLHKILQQLHDNHITHVAIEASSHGLDQYRLDGLNIKTAGFTNFTHDHLDYHNTMEDYFLAKTRLFTDLVKDTVVLNADVPEYQELTKICATRKLRKLTYGYNGSDLRLNKFEQDLYIEVLGKEYIVPFNVAGEFQIHNVLCALGIAISAGVDLEQLINSIPKLKSVPGRLEKAGNFNGGTIFVDYAHTPDGIKNTLLSLQKICKGRLVIVFGCGGDRDQGKREIMGEISSKLADIVIVTDDNPRTEDSSIIRKQILKGCPEAIEIPKREEAISYAIRNISKNDIVLIAGKGHENYQIIGTKKRYFSDSEEVKKCIVG